MYRRQIIALALSALATPPFAAAQAPYPDRPVTLIVPFSPGGGTDNIARLVAARLNEQTSKAFVIDNRPGGGTNIGNDAAARASADGYTLLLGQTTLSVNPHLYANLRYGPSSFAAVAHIANAPIILVVPADSPIRSVPDLIATARAQPGTLNYGSGGAGTPPHLAGELFQLSTRTHMVHVPYRGSAPALTDLMGGQINMMFDTATSALPYITSGRVRALAVAADARLPALPEVATFAEQGLTDFAVSAWYGIVAPRDIADARMQWLNTQVNAVLQEPATREQFERIGAVVMPGTPQQMQDFMNAQSTRWQRVIQDAGIRLN